MKSFIATGASASGKTTLINEAIKNGCIHLPTHTTRAPRMEEIAGTPITPLIADMLCGFGTSGATIGAVCAAINEMYGNPIKRLDLIKYIANNYGEEIEKDDANLQLV